MLNVGGPELLIILLVALVFLGPQRLPELARQMGQAVSSLKSLASGFQAELEAASRPDPEPSMTLKGPTKQSDAIAQTQNSGVSNDGAMKPQSDRTQPGASGSDPFVGSTKGTDPASVAKAAREVTYDDDERAVSSGGPQDLVAAPDGASQDAATPDGVSQDAATPDGVSQDGAIPDDGASARVTGASAPENTAPETSESSDDDA